MVSVRSRNLYSPKCFRAEYIFGPGKAKTPARIGDIRISTRHCPLGTVLMSGLTGTRISDAFKTDDYCVAGQSDIDLTSLWCGQGFEGNNGVCNDINECEDPETCKGTGLLGGEIVGNINGHIISS